MYSSCRNIHCGRRNCGIVQSHPSLYLDSYCWHIHGNNSRHSGYSFWHVSPLEFLIWLAAVLVTVFSTIENGIYTSICASLALFLIRVIHPHGYFLGKVTLLQEDMQDHGMSCEVYVPLKPDGVTNPQVRVHAPSPGVIIYQLEDSFIYLNSSLVNGTLVEHVKAHTQCGKDMSKVKPADRPWNDPGPGLHGAVADQEINELKPILHAIVLDFSAMYVESA